MCKPTGNSCSATQKVAEIIAKPAVHHLAVWSRWRVVLVTPAEVFTRAK